MQLLIMSDENKEAKVSLARPEGAAGIFDATAIHELESHVSPKHLYGIWDTKILGDGVELGGLKIISHDIKNLLKNHKKAVVLATTLGVQADSYLLRLMQVDIAKSVLAAEACEVLIEEYTNEIQKKLGGMGQRFSPGYGDFDIRYQKDILKMLNSEKIGLYMTDGFMLVPTKSVTSLFGIN